MPRVIYSLKFETERQPGAPIVEFVVLLDAEGNCRNIRPLGKPRVVDLRPGDWFTHRPTRERHKLTAISAYRQHHLSEEQAAARSATADGFLVYDK